MKKGFFCALLFILVCNIPTVIFAEVEEKKICEKCLAKQDRRARIIAILSSIAELARGLALLFSPNAQEDKLQYNEAVCGIIAGACGIASQATRSIKKNTLPDIYELLQDPVLIEELKTMLSQDVSDNFFQSQIPLVEIDGKTK